MTGDFVLLPFDPHIFFGFLEPFRCLQLTTLLSRTFDFVSYAIFSLSFCPISESTAGQVFKVLRFVPEEVL